MLGELFINHKDAYKEYGMSLTDGSLSALMTPPPIKALIESTYRLKPGKIVIPKNVVFDSRDLTLEVHFTGKDRDTFYENYKKFCKVLEGGVLLINTKYQPDVYYRCIYVSCTQFRQFVESLAKFQLKLNEPDPTNRGEEDKNS